MPRSSTRPVRCVDGRVVLYRLQPGQHGPITAWLAGPASVARSGSPSTRQVTSIRADHGRLDPTRRDPTRRDATRLDPTRRDTTRSDAMRHDAMRHDAMSDLRWNHLQGGLSGGRFPRRDSSVEAPSQARTRRRDRPGPAVPAATMTLHGPGSDRRWTTRLRERRPRRRSRQGPHGHARRQRPRHRSRQQPRRRRTRRRHRAPRHHRPSLTGARRSMTAVGTPPSCSA